MGLSLNYFTAQFRGKINCFTLDGNRGHPGHTSEIPIGVYQVIWLSKENDDCELFTTPHS
jgi:hypothetical protein